MSYKLITLDNRYVAKREFGFEYAVYFKKRAGSNDQFYQLRNLLERSTNYWGLCIAWARYEHRLKLQTDPWAYDYNGKVYNQVYVRDKDELERALLVLALTTE